MTAIEVPDLCRLNATELLAMMGRKEVSAAELMAQTLAHIGRVNPAVTAIVSLRGEEALMAEARAADEARARGETCGALHGLPMAVKDLAFTKGLRTTFGSPLFADLVPGTDAIFVERMRREGAIFTAKTNVPEFGYGSNSYNPIFGLTRNAWDPSRVGGGSSGGAGVGLALRMLSVADGSDMGGSLRNPAAWNNVYGFRPSQGRVPSDGLDPFYGQMATDGPMGRSAADLALLLSVQSGYDPRAPLSLDAPVSAAAPEPLDPKGLRFGWLGDYQGQLPFEDGVLELTGAAAALWADAGALVEPVTARYDMAQVWTSWTRLRQQSIGGRHDAQWRDPAQRALLKPEAQWEITQSHQLSGLDLYNAALARGAWYRHLMGLFQQYDFLLLPAAQVFPFAAETPWPKEVAGRKMDSYHRWMEVVAGATLAGCPSVSVPAGFSAEGLPMGLQIMAAPRQDEKLLRAVASWDRICPWLDRLPPMLR
ncbi:amidase [Falsigemmobacter faecalis]|uniref:Amidase n=1 Tax=Falsigemmobacter faecalis TaxID=2488730 RepID=A0A3P3D351_9RHOB|nr:amidase [Falsigemmobacter faecalis]RRH68857.1 amidase [Falsigemmobacter faecalis]